MKTGCFALVLYMLLTLSVCISSEIKARFYCFFTIFWGHYGLWLTHLFYLDLLAKGNTERHLLSLTALDLLLLFFGIN
jgi:hypothetical protein